MVLTVRCELCAKVIKCTQSGTKELSAHITQRHPNAIVTHFTCLREQKTTSSYKNVNCLNPNMSNCSTHRKSYPTVYNFTTVKFWKPGLSTVICLRCNKNVSPILQTQKSKITDSTFGAIMILFCWPLCFLPFLMNYCSDNKLNLYCPACGCYLGSYSRKTGLVLDFIERNCC